MRSTDALVGVLFMSTATLYWVTEVRTPRHVSRVPTVGQGRGLEEGSHLHSDSDIDAALRRHGGVAPPPPASELVNIKEVVKGDTTFEETIKHHRVRPNPLLIPIRKLDVRTDLSWLSSPSLPPAAYISLDHSSPEHHCNHPPCYSRHS